jgi:hypothetical protein
MSEAVAEPIQTQATIDSQAAREADKAARDAAVKKADAFFKSDIKEAPKGTPEDLFRKFGAKTTQDAEDHQQRIDDEKESARNAESNRPEPETKASLVDDEKKPGFIKSLKQTNEQLAKEAAELKKKVEEYDKAKQEIEELRSKIDDSESKKEVEKLRKELELAVKEKQEREEILTRDLEEVRKENAFLNLPASPSFRANFDAPILNGYNQIKMILGDDQSTLTEFSKAVQAYEASLTSQDPNEKAKQREISKQTLNYIYENLSPMEQSKFNSTAYDVLNKVEARSQAIANWEVTKAQTDEENNRRITMSKAQVEKRWQDAFNQARQQLEDAVKYNEEIAKIIASSKYDDDTTEDELIAEAALRENSNYAPEQITRVLMQGAKFKKSKAYSFALEKENAELKETIKKMRGSGTSEGSIGSSSSGKATEAEERTPAALFRKFQNR